MIADTTEELLEMVDKIGVKRKWIQYEGRNDEHFDICLSKKKLALKHGAIEVEFRHMAEMIANRTSPNVPMPIPIGHTLTIF